MAERRGVLLAVLVFAMTASSYQIFAISVLAVDIIDDLGVSRTALGFLGSLNTLVGALTAPTMGRVTDRIGARQAILVLLAISGLGMALMAMAGNWWLLAISAAVAGIPQGWGNPATNALIAERVSAATQGSVTGIKQSGVQLGIFLSGLTLPGLSLVIGWRGALWGYAVAFGLGAVVVARMLGQPDAEVVRARAVEQGPGGDGSVPSFIWLVSGYAFLFGSAGGAIGRFFPLWANEEIGLSTVIAGALVALGGLLGIAARITAGRLAQSLIAPPILLSILASIGALYCVMLLITPTVGSWILWPSTVLYAVGIGAWNAVAMLAVIVSVRRESAGKASGVVMLGFLGGLSVGSPIAGAIVDRWGTYQPVWLGALLLSVASAVIIHPRLSGSPRTAPASSTSG